MRRSQRSHVRLRIVALACASVVAAGTAAAAMKAPELADRAAVIQYASFTGDVRRLAELSETLSAESARGDLQVLVHYYSAYAAYRAAELDDDLEYRVGILLDRCVDEARAAIRLDRDFAEAHALIGACHGLAAARRPLSAIVAGNFSARELRRALALAPDNPRVLLLNAVTQRRRISDGGFRDEQAARQLREALRLFESDAPADGVASPDWGEAEAHLRLAELAMAQQAHSVARDHLERALLIAPDYRQVRTLLRSLLGA
jgi:hypothetical protein